MKKFENTPFFLAIIFFIGFVLTYAGIDSLDKEEQNRKAMIENHKWSIKK